MSSFEQGRTSFVDYIRRQLVGPFGGPEEVLQDPPERRYLMGLLFPPQSPVGAFFDAEGEYVDDSSSDRSGPENQFADDPLCSTNDFLPASQGFSFFTTASQIEVRASAARYLEKHGSEAFEALAGVEESNLVETDDCQISAKKSRGARNRVWKRQRFPELGLTLSAESPSRSRIWDGRAELHVRWRRFEGGNLITLTLANAQDPETRVDDGSGNVLAQCELKAEALDGSIIEYPSIGMTSHDIEEEELRLVYSTSRVFAIGHGCAVEWDWVGEQVKHVRTEVMPATLVPRVSASGGESKALGLHWLSNSQVSVEQIVEELREFVSPYSHWIESIKSEFPKSSHLQVAASAVIHRLELARDRMLDGILVLESHPERDRVVRAFQLANLAMLMQMRHSRRDFAGSRHERNESRTVKVEYVTGPSWRPFQLGFFLVTLRGLVDLHHTDRTTVDLIWFPTGGGKTEAYLLVAAFEIFLRRLRFGKEGGGTAVVSRYTLSLLTAQQFQRTGTTVAACEILRRSHATELGESPISLGLWVGDTTTPNRFSKAKEKFEELRQADETDDRFLLDRCPWCGTEIVPRKYSTSDDDYGIVANDVEFRFNCPLSSCPFNQYLPIHVVDEDIYENPPTFLLGTVDKFAQLAWISQGSSIFGSAMGVRPPSLIIQDELHLLSGPLGTTAGLYELAIGLLCEVDGSPAKIIASTATIRRASQQIRGLFCREVHVFPPSGVDSSDSYFARSDPESPGRLYVGLMAQGHSSDTAVVHTIAALVQAPVAVELPDLLKDSYSTLVVYHNSIRELGRTVTMANDDIPVRLDALVGEKNRRMFEVEELSSNLPRSQQPRILERLALSPPDPDAISFLATTNMLSVGVDVSRLGLMVVNGQPKSTAEYIQATSRVGRDRTPGLVFGLFRSTRPRDRSHFESFKSYHSALYRFVEPVSVTPFSPPSRERALHAAMVIVARHRLGMTRDSDAGMVLQKQDDIRQISKRMVEAVEFAEPREANATAIQLETLLQEWIMKATLATNQGKSLYFSSNGKGHVNLLKRFGERGDGWPTLDSMRNVDGESLVQILGSGGK